MIQQRITDREQWTAALLGLPEPHLLQTWQWGEVKRQTGWQPSRLLWSGEFGGAPVAAASLLVRRISSRLPLGVAYVPKGPLLDWSNAPLVDAVLAAIELEARRQRAIFVKIDPDVSPASQSGQAVQAALRRRGWRPSAEQIQFRNTALLDLTPDEDALLAAMKPKWRYNIRLAERRGVLVRRGDVADLPAFYALYRETGGRDGFIVRPFDYYEATWRTFMQPLDAAAPCADLLLAEVEGDAVAGLILFRFGRQGVVHVRRIQRPPAGRDAQPPAAMGGDAAGARGRLHRLRPVGRARHAGRKRRHVGRLALQRGLRRAVRAAHRRLGLPRFIRAVPPLHRRHAARPGPDAPPPRMLTPDRLSAGASR